MGIISAGCTNFTQLCAWWLLDPSEEWKDLILPKCKLMCSSLTGSQCRQGLQHACFIQPSWTDARQCLRRIHHGRVALRVAGTSVTYNDTSPSRCESVALCGDVTLSTQLSSDLHPRRVEGGRHCFENAIIRRNHAAWRLSVYCSTSVSAPAPHAVSREIPARPAGRGDRSPNGSSTFVHDPRIHECAKRIQHGL